MRPADGLRSVPGAARRLRVVEDRRRALGGALPRGGRARHRRASPRHRLRRPARLRGARRRGAARAARCSSLGSPGDAAAARARRDVAEAVVRALRAAACRAEPLDLVGPEQPTQAGTWLARRVRRGDERLVPIYARRVPRGCCGGSRRCPGPRGARAPTRSPGRRSRCATTTRPTERALGWRPRIGLDDGLAPRAEPRVARGVVTSRRGRLP